MSLDPKSMLLWADLDARVVDVEHEARTAELTLGPLAIWNKDLKIVDMLRARSGFRVNPALCRIEEVVSAFEYERHGVRYKTVSTPREACGPELKQALYGALDTVKKVELRLLPHGELLWLKLTARDVAEVHTFARSLVRDGIVPREVWTELASAWLAFSGGMRQAYFRIAEARARERGLDAQESQAPIGAGLSAGFIPEVKSWETLGPRDSLVLCDPWAVLAR